MEKYIIDIEKLTKYVNILEEFQYKLSPNDVFLYWKVFGQPQETLNLV